MSVHDSNLTVNGSSFVENTANQGGGINAADMSDVEITDSLFYGNTAQYGAGASVFKQQSASADLESNLKLSGVTFEANNAQEGRGGGLYANTLSSMTIGENTVFKDNYAKEGGAGIYAQSVGNIDIADGTIFKNNTSADSGSYGGAIFAVTQDDIESSLNIGNNVLFDGNSANYGSAIYAQTLKELTIGDNVKFINNNGGDVIRTADVAEISIGDNAAIQTNTNKYTSVYAYNANNFTIGDNFTLANNSGPSYISASFSGIDREFTLGDNANLSDNENKSYEMISASGVNNFTIGDNLKMNNNIGSNSLYAYFNSSYKDGVYKIGDNAEIIGNRRGETYPYGIFYVRGAKDIELGNNITIKDNISSPYAIDIYVNNNTINNATLKIGKDFVIDNNTFQDYATYITNQNR